MVSQISAALLQFYSHLHENRRYCTPLYKTDLSSSTCVFSICEKGVGGKGK